MISAGVQLAHRRARSFRVQPMSGLLRFFDDDAVLAVVLPQAHRDALALRRRQVLADVVGADGQLAVAAVDQDGQLDDRAGRPRSISASSAARMVRPVKSTSSTRTTVLSLIENGMSVPRITGAPAHVEVVAVERDVERAHRTARCRRWRRSWRQPLGEGHPARADADEGQVLGAAVALEDLVGDAGEGAVEGGLVENLRFFAQAGWSGLTDLSFEPLGPA